MAMDEGVFMADVNWQGYASTSVLTSFIHSLT